MLFEYPFVKIILKLSSGIPQELIPRCFIDEKTMLNEAIFWTKIGDKP